LHLCQTAFSIVVERAAKYAREDVKKLRIIPERSSQDEERCIAAFRLSQAEGAPFLREQLDHGYVLIRWLHEKRGAIDACQQGSLRRILMGSAAPDVRLT
jgi:hypothetical protein